MTETEAKTKGHTMTPPDLDDNELDDEASRKFHEALASGKAKVRLKTMPTTPPDTPPALPEQSHGNGGDHE